jgi:predicted DNA-binding helix-hairpin-helix protein
MRKYGFTDSDILFNEDGRLSLEKDPKQVWADAHPEYFPVNINKADKYSLLRVPGLGPAAVKTILQARKTTHITKLRDVLAPTKLTQKALSYITF